MKNLIGVLLACCAFAANAQSLVGLGTGSCNVAQTVCSVPNDAGDTITFVYNQSTAEATLVVTSVAPDLTTSTVTYSGALQFGPPTAQTNYLIDIPFTSTLSPSAVLDGSYRKTRSGSGRGGWAWHGHWNFHTLLAN